MAEDYRKLVKNILTNEETKKVVIHIPEGVDVATSDKVYQQIYATLVKHGAAYATVHTTTELRSGDPIDLHDYLLEQDPKYKSA